MVLTIITIFIISVIVFIYLYSISQSIFLDKKGKIAIKNIIFFSAGGGSASQTHRSASYFHLMGNR